MIVSIFINDLHGNILLRRPNQNIFNQTMKFQFKKKNKGKIIKTKSDGRVRLI